MDNYPRIISVQILFPPLPPIPEQFLMSMVTWTKKFFILLSSLWQKCSDRAKKEEDKAVHYFKHVIPLLFSAAGGLFKTEIISHCGKKKKKDSPRLSNNKTEPCHSRAAGRGQRESQVAKKVPRKKAAEGKRDTCVWTLLWHVWLQVNVSEVKKNLK